MFRKGAKTYILLDIATNIVANILALFVIIGFCLNNDPAYRNIIIIGAITMSIFFIWALLNSIKEFIDIIKE
jgi:hypothetical protein